MNKLIITLATAAIAGVGAQAKEPVDWVNRRAGEGAC